MSSAGKTNNNTKESAKDAILRSIREALPGEPMDPLASYSRIDRQYTRTGTLTPQQSLELFTDRLLDYDTEILDIPTEEGIPAAIEKALANKGETSLLAPLAFPQAWLPGSVRVVRDTLLGIPQLDAETAVVTTCEAAVSSTGTILLVHDGAQGRRVLTLLPDHHICLVRRDQIFETIPEAFDALTPRLRKPITTISGPSATSDIEMTRIRGVHGPRELTVILYGPPLIRESAAPRSCVTIVQS